MDVFFELVYKLLPVYLLVLLGYIAGKTVKIPKEPIAILLIYIIVPVVVFRGVSDTHITWGTVSLPILFFLISVFISVITYYFAGLFWRDETRNILGFLAGSANTGFFGLPVAIAIFGSSAISTVTAAILGTTLYFTSFGYFLAAKGKHTTKEALMKVIKLPVLYAYFVGLIFSWLNLKLSAPYAGLTESFVGAFIVLGMMLVGLGLADIKKISFDFKFISISFLAKFVVWPAVTIAVLFTDKLMFKLYDPAIHSIIILMSIVPVAANIVAFATILKTHPEKSSLAVFLSTVFALFYVPLVAAIFF